MNFIRLNIVLADGTTTLGIIPTALLNTTVFSGILDVNLAPHASANTVVTFASGLTWFVAESVDSILNLLPSSSVASSV